MATFFIFSMFVIVGNIKPSISFLISDWLTWLSEKVTFDRILKLFALT